MEAFLRGLLPRLLPDECSFEVHPFQGKGDVFGKLEARLRAYARWLPNNWRIVVVVDRDDQNCHDLKQRLEAMAKDAGLVSRARGKHLAWQLVNRIAIEELESWYFGDWQAVRTAYPGVPDGIVRKRGFRDPDAIMGGTWEAFERVLKRHGYFETGLRKVEAARVLGKLIERQRSISRSFVLFCDAILEATT